LSILNLIYTVMESMFQFCLLRRKFRIHIQCTHTKYTSRIISPPLHPDLYPFNEGSIIIIVCDLFELAAFQFIKPMEQERCCTIYVELDCPVLSIVRRTVSPPKISNWHSWACAHFMFSAIHQYWNERMWDDYDDSYLL